jgi:MerR family transcriptional regulator, heat shock protein HspR
MRNDHRPLYAISIVAEMLGVHPQTLRLYERQGLITPNRTSGKTRLYSERDVEQLRVILHLTQDLGINLAGVGLLLDLQEQMHQMQNEMRRTFDHLQDSLETGPHVQAKAHPEGDPKSISKKIIKIKIERG